MSAATSLDAAIAQLVDERLARMRTPGLDWSPCRLVHLSPKVARALVAKGLRISRVGKGLWVHVPTLNKMIEAGTIAAAAAPSSKPMTSANDERDDVLDAFGVTPVRAATRR